MARNVVTTTNLTDDLAGGIAHRTLSFAYDGAAYEIDLSKRNARAFEKALEPYISAARRSSSRRTKSAAGAKARPKRDLTAVRTWAQTNGHAVASRGRIPSAVLEAYDASRSQ